jgi:hypothetical protein
LIEQKYINFEQARTWNYTLNTVVRLNIAPRKKPQS